MVQGERFDGTGGNRADKRSDRMLLDPRERVVWQTERVGWAFDPEKGSRSKQLTNCLANGHFEETDFVHRPFFGQRTEMATRAKREDPVPNRQKLEDTDEDLEAEWSEIALEESRRLEVNTPRWAALQSLLTSPDEAAS